MLLDTPMKLADWLEETRTRRSAFAKRIGVYPSVISDYCNGRYCPRPKIARAISRETDGRVTPNDFVFEEAAE